MKNTKNCKLNRSGRKHILTGSKKTYKLLGGSDSGSRSKRSLHSSAAASVRHRNDLSQSEQKELDEMILMFKSVHDNMVKNQSLFAREMKLHDDELLNKYHYQGANTLLEQPEGVDIEKVMYYIKHKDTLDKKTLYSFLKAKLHMLNQVIQSYPHLYRLHKKVLNKTQLSPGGSLKLPSVPDEEVGLHRYDAAITELNGYFDSIKASRSVAGNLGPTLVSEINNLTAKIRHNNSETPVNKARTIGLTKQIEKMNKRLRSAINL